MCIRDRLQGAAGEAGDLRQPLLQPAKQFGVPLGLIQRHERCLLYTSDAADERSSVDLGGRRIIKKKKKLTDDTNGRTRTLTQRTVQI